MFTRKTAIIRSIKDNDVINNFDLNIFQYNLNIVILAAFCNIDMMFSGHLKIELTK